MRPSGVTSVVLVVVASLWALWLGWCHLVGERTALDRAEALFADARLLIAGPRTPPRNVVIVAIDNATVARERGYPIPRSALAQLISTIGAAKPRAIAVDLLLVDETVPDADAALANALMTSPSVIAAAGQFDRAASTSPFGMPRTSSLLWPARPFEEAAKIGLTNIATESGTPRHLPLLFQTDRGLQPSFALRSAALNAGDLNAGDLDFSIDKVRIAGAPLALDLGYHLPLRFYGPGGTFETISASSILSGLAPPLALQDRIVVIGVTATGVGDTFGTPFDPILPGVEVLATGIAQLTGGDTLVRDSTVRKIDTAATILFTIGAALIILLVPVSAGLVLVAAAVGLWLAATVVLFGHGYWLSATLPLAGAIPSVAAATFLRQVADRRHSRELARAAAALRQFHSPVLADRIARNPDFLREPVKQTAVILFLDLSGFTRLSEQLGLSRTQELLMQFHTLVTNKAVAHGGLVMNAMGDGAMIAFGIPDPQADDASRAFDTAWELVKDIHAWIDQGGKSGRLRGMRLGGHLGPVVMSRLGPEMHQHISATGDTVNVASRLMEVAKEHNATIAVTTEFFAAVGEAGARHRKPDEIRSVEIRGRLEHATVALWRAMGDA
jgi:adenylate cyclase